jgi:hypothetical protein
MEVVCLRENASQFEDLGCCEQDWRTDLPEGVAFLVDEEANYGHDEAIRSLSAKGLAFCARHDEGGEYHAAVIACDDLASVRWRRSSEMADRMFLCNRMGRSMAMPCEMRPNTT